MRFAKILAAACAIVSAICLAGVVVAQEVGPDEIVRIRTDLVSVPVIVNDRQGRYISGLKQEDFSVYQDGAKQQISFFAAEEEPLTVALLLDTSKSTSEVLDKIKDAAKNFIKLLRPTDRCMIVSFDYAVHVLSPLTSDQKALEKAIKRAEIGEMFGTVLRDAVLHVVERSLAGIKGRKALIVLTDGKDFGSYPTQAELLHSLEESEAMIYTVFYKTDIGAAGFNRGGRGQFPGGRMGGGFPPRRRMERRRIRDAIDNEDAMEFLARMSELTAGRFYNREVTDLKKTFQLIADELRNQYRIGYYPPQIADDDGQLHRIKVQTVLPEVIVRTRTTYRTKRFANH